MAKIKPCNTSILLCGEGVNTIRALLDTIFNGVQTSSIAKFCMPLTPSEVFFYRERREAGLFDRLFWG